MWSECTSALAWLMRATVLLLGFACAGWSVTVLPIFGLAERLRDVSDRIISDQQFKPGRLNDVLARIEARPEIRPPLPAVTRAEALVRLRAADDTMRQSAEASDSAVAVTETSLKRAIALNPQDSFLWLMLYSLQNTRNGFDLVNLGLVEQSYASGPLEGWIALRRNRLALAVFPSLDRAAQTQVVNEFAEIVDADFQSDAEVNLIGIGWPYRDRLLAGLERVDIASRQMFARMLVHDGYDVQVPGVKPKERPW